MKLKTVFALALVALLSACASRSHIRGCELSHPYHQAQQPQPSLVLAEGLTAPRTQATFNVPEQQHLAPKSDDLLTENDVETLEKEALMDKRCILAPPRLAVASEPAA